MGLTQTVRTRPPTRLRTFRPGSLRSITSLTLAASESRKRTFVPRGTRRRVPAATGVVAPPTAKMDRESVNLLTTGGAVSGSGSGSGGAGVASSAPMSTATPAIRGWPSRSVVRLAGTSVLLPLSIVGLAVVSCTSPAAAPASAGSAQMFDVPGAAAPGEAHTSLNDTSRVAKPARSAPTLPATIEFAATSVSSGPACRPGVPPAPAWLDVIVELMSSRRTGPSAQPTYTPPPSPPAPIWLPAATMFSR